MAVVLHALVVIMLSGQDFAVWIISEKEAVGVTITATHGTCTVYKTPWLNPLVS